jgi:hypothetical protein
MSKRLQVLISDDEMEALGLQARSENLSVGEYVRRVLRDAGTERPGKSPATKLAAIRSAVRCSFPTAAIEEMNREIERGYQS